MAEDMVNVYRGELIESIHQGDIVVVDKDGKLLYEFGDKDKITYWRSAAKPVQAIDVVSSGAAEKYNLSDKELAVMCASHSGEDQHVKVVRGILDKIGLDESALDCGTHPPLNKKTARRLCKNGEKATEIRNNCSGKHAGMLTLCQYYGWDIKNYPRLDHKLQQHLLKIVSDITDYPKDKIYKGVDGCGVVVYGMPLKNMAYAFARLSAPNTLAKKYQEAAKRITKSMEKYPELVAGSKRFNTELLKVANGEFFAKSGAQGVYCVGHEYENIAIALKVKDGSSRGARPAVVEAMKQLDLLSKKQLEKLKKYHEYEIKNHHGDKIGKAVADFKLKKVK
ncbi:MAG: asparaginase [Bacillota bacterium]